MARVANRFTNPVTGGFYDWILNHNEEEASGLERTIEHTAPTDGIGLIRQQGEEGPMVLQYRGSILQESQISTFRAWYNLCRSQTIYFRDFNGDEYEVLITSFKPQRKRVVRNPRDPVNAPMHTWTYEMSMEVLRVISGPWAGVHL